MAQKDRQWQKTTTDTDGTPRTTMAQRQRRQWHTKNNDGTTTKTTMAQQQRPGVDPHARTSNAAAMMSRKGARQKRWHTKNNDGTPRHDVAKNNNGHRWHTKNNDGTTTKTVASERRAGPCCSNDVVPFATFGRIRLCSAFAGVRRSPLLSIRR